MTKAKEENIERSLSLDIGEETYYRLRSRGILILDETQVDVLESGVFYRDMFYLVMSGWPKEKPIWVMLNSPGGDAYQCFAICDTINSFTAQGYTINIVGIGIVASAATIVLQTGTRRYALPNTRFLTHQLRQTHNSEDEEVSHGKERIAELERINEQGCQIIAKRIGMDFQAELFPQITKTDLWKNAEEAKKFGPNGLIDEICTTFPFMDVLQKKD